MGVPEWPMGQRAVMGHAPAVVHGDERHGRTVAGERACGSTSGEPAV